MPPGSLLEAQIGTLGSAGSPTPSAARTRTLTIAPSATEEAADARQPLRGDQRHDRAGGHAAAVVAGPGTGVLAGPAPYPAAYARGEVIELDPAGALDAQIGAANLRAWLDGQDSVGHQALSN